MKNHITAPAGRRFRAGLAARPRLFTARTAVLAVFPALIITVLAVLLAYTASASEPGVFEKPPDKFILFSSEAVYEPCGDVFVFFSDVEFSAVSGNIYAFFSRLAFRDGAAAGLVRTFQTTVAYAAGIAVDVAPFLGGLFLTDGFTDGGLPYISDVLPGYITRAMFILFGAVLCFAAFLLFGGFVAQGGVVITAEPSRVLRNGIVVYLLAAALIMVFALTIILLPFALLFLLLLFIMIVMGQTSLSMLIGLTAARRAGKRLSPAACLFIGLTVLTVITNIPFLGQAVAYVSLPILTTGITLTNMVNGLIKKQFYYAPFKAAAKKRGGGLNRDAAKRIILGGGKEPTK